MPEDGQYEALIKYGCDQKDTGGQFMLTTKRDTLTANVQETGGSLNFKDMSIGVLPLTSGKNILKIEPVKLKEDSPLMNLLQVSLIPKN